MSSSKEDAFLKESVENPVPLEIQLKAQNLCLNYLSTTSSPVSVLTIIQNHSIEVCLECVSSKEDAFIQGSVEVRVHIGDTGKSSELMPTLFINSF